MKKAFGKFEYCLPSDLVDIQNDEFQLLASGNDGVCITSIILNGNQIFVGLLNDLPSFWIDGNQNECSVDSMSTKQITIKNGKIHSSECKNPHNGMVVNHFEQLRF